MRTKKETKEKAEKSKKEYQKPKAQMTKISLGVWGGSCSGSCLAPSTKIATPTGQQLVTRLKVGDKVWTIDKAGKKNSLPIKKTSKTRVSKTHMIIYLMFADGRKLFVSPDHPIASTRKVRQLFIGEYYDKTYVSSLKLISYKNTYTYDILPEGATGYYWANDILMGSTLKEEKRESVVKTFQNLEFVSV